MEDNHKEWLRSAPTPTIQSEFGLRLPCLQGLEVSHEKPTLQEFVVQEAVHRCLRDAETGFFYSGIFKLMQHRQKCMDSYGDSAESDRLCPLATSVFLNVLYFCFIVQQMCSWLLVWLCNIMYPENGLFRTRKCHKLIGHFLMGWSQQVCCGG